jgi:hypothetical protein
MFSQSAIRAIHQRSPSSNSQRLSQHARHYDEQLLLFMPQDHAKIFSATRSFFQFEFRRVQHTVKTVSDWYQQPRSRPKKIIHVILIIKLKFSPRGGGRHMGSLCGYVKSPMYTYCHLPVSNIPSVHFISTQDRWTYISCLYLKRHSHPVSIYIYSRQPSSLMSSADRAMSSLLRPPL